MQYAVHLYPTVHVKVIGIEANSVAEAAAKADASVDLHDILDNSRPGASNVECVAWDEGENNFVLVDVLNAAGEVMCGKTCWLDGSFRPLVDGKTPVERKAVAADDASLFFQELLDSVESLAAIADTHGPRTLADLMYLHSAILKSSCIDHYPNESDVLTIAQGLPSGERWAGFVKRCELEAVEG